MLDVSEAVIQAYIDGNAQTEIFLTVTKTDGTVSVYDPTNILSGSVSIVESLCSSQAFDISRVEKNQLTFTLFNITEGLKGLQGGSVVAKQRVTLPDGNTVVDIPLGTYTIVEAMNDGDYLYKCTCYDTTMYKLDGLIDDWWKAVRFPITLRNLAISMFEYLGCSYDIPAEFNNYGYVVPQMNAVFEGVTGTEILGYIQEIVGGFFKANRFGVITLRVPVPTASGLYPHIGLYPHTGLYPRRSSSGFGVDGEVGIGDWNYPQIVGDLQLGDFDVKRVTKVQIRGTEDDIGIIAGGGTNTYVIQGNPLLFNLTDETGRQIAENILSAVGQIAYKPFSGKFMAQPYVEVGDMAMISTLEQKEGISPIFQRTLSGARLAFDTFQCLGLEEREQVSSINRKITTVNQRTHEVINTVDELVSTVTQVEQTVETHTTQISQNSDEINLIAERTGYQNYVVNGDFSDISDPFKGWVKSVRSGNTVEIVDDPRFPSGKACHFVQVENGNAVAYYEFDFGEEIDLYGKKIVVYEQVEHISSSYSTYLHSRILGKKTDETFEVLFTGDVSHAVGTKNIRFVYTPTNEKIVTALRILPFFEYTNNVGEGKFGQVCVIIVDADDEIPARGFYTDLPKNDLISQINIAPSGVTIQGEKIDIKGITTFSSSSSGTTVIDGGTVNVTNLNASNITTGTLSGNYISGGVINGIEIDSGDMYWYKGTSNEASIRGMNITYGSTTYKGVRLQSDAVYLRSQNGIIWLENVSGSQLYLTGSEATMVYSNSHKISLNSSESLIQYDSSCKISLSSTASLMQYDNSRKIYINNSASLIQYDDSHFVSINSSNLTMRYGNTLFKCDGTYAYVKTPTYGTTTPAEHKVVWRSVTSGSTSFYVLALA